MALQNSPPASSFPTSSAFASILHFGEFEDIQDLLLSPSISSSPSSPPLSVSPLSLFDDFSGSEMELFEDTNDKVGMD